MILCRITQAPFCALLSGSRDRISEPRNFDPVTIGCGFADHALQCSKPGTDASYRVLTALGGLAEFERDLSRGRTSDGREWAKARSFKLGRKPKLTEHQQRLSSAKRCEASPATTTRFPD